MTEAADRTPELLGRLLQVWEDSVRATHLFLSDAEIKDIKAYVPQALNGIAHLVTAECLYYILCAGESKLVHVKKRRLFVTFS